MTTTNCKTFKGEIENYLVNGQNNIDSKTNNLFRSLKLKTWLCRTNIVKGGRSCRKCLALFYTLIIIGYAEISKVSKVRCPPGAPEGKAEFQAANSTLAGFRFNLSNQNEFVFLCERARLKYPRKKHEQLNPSVWYSWT